MAATTRERVSGSHWYCYDTPSEGSVVNHQALRVSLGLGLARVRGLSCDGSVCVATPGESCRGSASRCGLSFGLACVGDSATTDGISRPSVEAFQLSVGARCDPEFKDYCEAPAICALVAGRDGEADAVHRCEAPYAASGPCHTGFPDGCPHGQYCIAEPDAPGDVPGVCTRMPGLASE